MTEPLTFTVWLLMDESGANAIAYGLPAGLIALVIVSAVIVVGTTLETTFTAVGTCLAGLTAVACQ